MIDRSEGRENFVYSLEDDHEGLGIFGNPERISILSALGCERPESRSVEQSDLLSPTLSRLLIFPDIKPERANARPTYVQPRKDHSVSGDKNE